MPSYRLRLALLAGIFLACACSPSLQNDPHATAWFTGVPDPESEPSFAPSSAPASAAAMKAAAAGYQVLTEPGELPRLTVAADADKPLPLDHTRVSATLSGFTADVEVAQTYKNPYGEIIEASYVFPLPENAAVYSMKIVIGERVIEAVVKDRQAARRTYERAKSEGYTAALLEQERPNVFTQSVANIEPAKTIDVVIRYVQDLSYDAGEYEFVFPMVVGPRYMPGAALDGAQAGSGTHADTTQVPDASRISPPVLGKGERSGHDISLEVVASAAGAVSDFAAPTHDVIAEKRADGSLRLKLSDKDTIPNRDFVLRYRVAGEKPKAILYAAGKDNGYFSLVVQPPALDVNELVGKRELVFVVDVSGSMSGRPLALCKEAMREAIANIRPVDTFNVITFAGATGKAFQKPRSANDAAIHEALAYVDQMSAGGGTEMLNAITEALSPAVERGRHRYVFFLTDGEVGNEDEILSATSTFVSEIESKGQHARVFGFGAGSSVNRALLDGLGRHGRGLTVYATNREDPARAVNRFYRYIDRSVLRNVKIDFGALGASDVFPAELPDLFASHPMIVHGRFKGSLAAQIVVRADGKDGPVEIPVSVARAPMDDGWPLQGLLWARSKIGWLEADLWNPMHPTAAAEITTLGVEHHLVTRFTSFVAVDRSKKVGDGNPVHVVQPVEVPEGVDADMAGALSRAAGSGSVSSGSAALKKRGEASGGADRYGYDFEDDTLASGDLSPSDQRLSRDVAADRNRLDMMVVSGQMYSVQQSTRGPRGCNCDLGGGRESRAGAWAALSALAIAALRKRTKRPAAARERASSDARPRRSPPR
jgi:Ca-activated chloride channel family protein